MKRRLGTLVFALLLAFWVAPWHLLLAQVQHGIQWTWTAVVLDTAGNTIVVDGYNAYCSSSATGPFTTKSNTSLLTTPTFFQTGLTVGTTYFCQFTAVKGTAESTHSPSGSAVFQFPPAAPGIPVGVAR